MNKQLAAIRRIRPASDVTPISEPPAPSQLEFGAGTTGASVAAVCTELDGSCSADPAVVMSQTAPVSDDEPRADEGWRRQFIHALRDIDRQGATLDAPAGINPTPESTGFELPDERIAPPRIIARPEAGFIMGAEAGSKARPETGSPSRSQALPQPLEVMSLQARLDAVLQKVASPIERDVPASTHASEAQLAPVASAPSAQQVRNSRPRSDERSWRQAMRRVVSPLAVEPSRHRALQMAGVIALASLVSSNPLHSAIPPESRPNLAGFAIALSGLRQDGARLLAAERAIEQAIARATAPSSSLSDPILEATPRLVSTGQAAAETVASDVPAPASAVPSGQSSLDRKGLESLIASLPDQANTPAPSAPTPPVHQVQPEKKASIAPTTPASTPIEEPLVRIAPEPDELEAAESGDGDIRPTPRQARRKAQRKPRRVVTRQRAPITATRRMSAGATPAPTTIVKSSGLFAYIGSLIKPEPRIWSDPSVARP